MKSEFPSKLLLEYIYTQSPNEEMSLTWARWLLNHGFPKEASSVMARLFVRLDSMDKERVEQQWRNSLDGVTEGDSEVDVDEEMLDEDDDVNIIVIP